VINRNEPKHPDPPILKRAIPPAPYLTSRGTCSDCHVPVVIAGDGDLKICPKCYGLLWHRDYAIEQRRARQAAAAAAAAATEVRRAQKEAQKQLDRESKVSAEMKEPK
jgi:hypothetical protein